MPGTTKGRRRKFIAIQIHGNGRSEEWVLLGDVAAVKGCFCICYDNGTFCSSSHDDDGLIESDAGIIAVRGYQGVGAGPV